MKEIFYRFKNIFRVLQNEGIFNLYRKYYISKIRNKDYEKQLIADAKYLDSSYYYDNIKKLSYKPKISVIMPVYNVDELYLIEAVESVLNQYYKNFELCIVDDCSSRKHIKDVLKKYSLTKKNVKIKYLTENKGIAEASNEALAIAEGEYVCFLDNDDKLFPTALYEVVRTLNKNREIEIIYTDEDMIDSRNNHTSPLYKPGWSPDMLLSCMYFGHLMVYKRSLIEKTGGFRKSYTGSQDYDLLLRAVSICDKIVHIPKILYSWRMLSSSTALNPESKSYAYDAAVKTIDDYLKRQDIDGKTYKTDYPGFYIVRRKISTKECVTVIVEGKMNDKDRVVDDIKQCCNYENVEYCVINTNTEKHISRAYNNLIDSVTGEYLLMITSAVRKLSDGWMERLLEHAVRKEVGAIGGKIVTSFQKVISAGIILKDGYVKHVSNPYFNSLNIIRNYSAVSRRFLMIRKSLFRQYLFDTEFISDYFDIDLCLRLINDNYLITFTPESVLKSKVIDNNYNNNLDLELFKKKWEDYEDPFFCEYL